MISKVSYYINYLVNIKSFTMAGFIKIIKSERGMKVREKFKRL